MNNIIKPLECVYNKSPAPVVRDSDSGVRVYKWYVEDPLHWSAFGLQVPPELAAPQENVCFCWLTFSSPLGPRTEISPQFRRENARMDAPRFFKSIFHQTNVNITKIYYVMEKSAPSKFRAYFSGKICP